MGHAQRLKRVFGIDVETCQACGGALKIIACIEDPVVVEKGLTHLDKEVTSAQVPRYRPAERRHEQGRRRPAGRN